jgi:hypothetical protein
MFSAKRLVMALIGFTTLVLFSIMVTFGLAKVRDFAAREQSRSSLKEIALGLSAYYNIYHHLPPAIVYDKHGKPLYSWRVLLLPYCGLQQEEELYKEFHLDEPWDSPHNQQFVNRRPWFYGRRGDPAGMTRYRVFIGPHTAFDPDNLNWHGFERSDERFNTIIVVEAAEAVPWTAPFELEYDDAKPLAPLSGGYPLSDGFQALCGRGRFAYFISSKADEQAIRALIKREAPEEVDWRKLELGH